MKTRLLSAVFFSLLLATFLSAKEANWTGNYTDKKYLNGQGVVQLNILQEGERITVDFDGVYNDGHGCAPEANGPAKIVNKDMLKFTFTDTAGNAGSGTIKRAGNDVIISVKATKVADSRCLVFYGDNIRLKPAR